MPNYRPTHTDYLEDTENGNLPEPIEDEEYFVRPALLYDPAIGCDRKVFEISIVNNVTNHTQVIYYNRPDKPGYMPVGASLQGTYELPVYLVGTAQQYRGNVCPPILSGPDYPIPPNWYVPIKFVTSKVASKGFKASTGSVTYRPSSYDDSDSDYDFGDSLPDRGDIGLASDSDSDVEYSSD